MSRNLIPGVLLLMLPVAVSLGGCTDDKTETTDTGSGAGTVTDSETIDTEATDTQATDTEGTGTQGTETEATETEATESESVTDTEATETAETDSESQTETETTDSESETETEATDTEATETVETDSESETETEDTDSSTELPGKYCYYVEPEVTKYYCLDHGETCEDPEILPGEGTYVFSNAPFVGDYTWDDAPLYCMPSEKKGQDLVYAIDLPAMKKLSARVDGIPVNGIPFFPKLFVSTSCDELVTSCVGGQSASWEDLRTEYTNDSDQPVRLFLVVDSDFGDAGLFSLDVKFLEPEVAKTIGDSCAEAVTLDLPAPGGSNTITFSHESLSETPSADNVCDSTSRDGFVAFTVDAPSKISLQTLTAFTSKHAVFLYENGCDLENAGDFIYSEVGPEPTNCGPSKFSSKLGGFYTLIEVDAVPGVNYVYGVQLFDETQKTSEFELTITVE